MSLHNIALIAFGPLAITGAIALLARRATRRLDESAVAHHGQAAVRLAELEIARTGARPVRPEGTR